MKSLTFEQLPDAMCQLFEKLENIERLLNEKSNQQTKTSSQDLLTVHEAAELLSLAVPTVYSMVSKGDIPYMKRSKRLYFDRSELVDYIREGRQETNQEIIDGARTFLTKGRRSTK